MGTVVRWAVACACGAGLMAPAPGHAQEYEPIRVDFGLIGGYSSGLSEGGFGGVVEPKLLVDAHIAVAVRVEGMVTFGASVGDGDSSFSTGSSVVLGPKVEYLLGTTELRPFVGIGAGLHGIGGDTIESGSDQVIVSHKSGRYFGVFPSAGIDIGRLRLSVTYHAIAGAGVEVDQTVDGATTRRDFSQNFYTFELSLFVGGSRLVPGQRADDRGLDGGK